MKAKNKGFFQLSVIIALVAGTLLIGGVGYIGLNQYRNSQKENSDRIKQAEELAKNQQKVLDQAQTEIEKLKTESVIAKQNQQVLEQKVINDQQKSSSQSSSISTSEINNYIGGVTQVSCTNATGTGFLMSLDIGYVTVTNDHVIAGNNWCTVLPNDSNGAGMGHYKLDLLSPREWNKYTDIAILKMSVSPAAQSWSKPLASLNYNLSSLRSCSSKMPEGSPVIVIGYPAFGIHQVQVEGYSSSVSSKQVTEGIISGYDSIVERPIGNLPYSNYYVSAKIDSGNSGGIALSKDSSGLCLLGVATWLSLGNYQTQGVIQNIHNVKYTE